MSVEAQRPDPEETARERDAHAGEGRSPEWDYPADRAGIDPETARKFSDRWSEFAEQKSKIDAGKAAMI